MAQVMMTKAVQDYRQPRVPPMSTKKPCNPQGFLLDSDRILESALGEYDNGRVSLSLKRTS